MIERETIDEVKNRLVKTYDPLKIYLFGSYAWGSPSEDSDLDLLVVVDSSEERFCQRVRPGQRALFGLCIPKDIIVYTGAEFEKYAQDVTTLSYKIANEGELLYAKS